MSWTTPPVVSVGELQDASGWNATMDNLTFLHDAGYQQTTASGVFAFAAPSELTIATGAITVTKNFHTVDTEADAATDDLETITHGAGVTTGHLLILMSVDSGRDTTVKSIGNPTQNIILSDGIDFTLATAGQSLLTLYSIAGDTWGEISRSA